MARNESGPSSPRMADVALEVLQNLGEEAKDVVYYEALNRVHGVSNRILKLNCICLVYNCHRRLGKYGFRSYD